MIAKKNRILVTGGAGFIGSHLCKALVAEGHNVFCLDNLFTGRERNIIKLRKAENFSFIEGDICDPINLHVDQIYNLACPASPIHYQADPIQTLKTSVLGSLNLLELARKFDARILLASTSEIYGDPQIHPQPENYWGNVNPNGIRSCYDEGKRCAETLFFDFNRQYGTDIRVVRIFNTYGPNMNPEDGRVVSNLIVKALKGEALSIYGDGTQTRSFQYIDDLIRGLRLMMENDKGFAGPVNLGNDKEYKILELAQKIKEKVQHCSGEIEFAPLPSDDPKIRRPDISVAREKLGWQPIVDVDTGLDATITYFDGLLKNHKQAV